MKISLENISKKFQRYWIFKNISYIFNAPETYALLGSNGSGKSTLLRIIAGIQTPSLGVISIEKDGKPVSKDSVYGQISFCAPGMEIVEELSLTEFFNFHFNFKKPVQGLSTKKIIEITGLQDSAHKPITDFSSGMKQRVKLAQAIFSDTPVLLLDEPCTNLDQTGVEQYIEWVRKFTKGRLVIVASNDPREYCFCKEMIEVEKYKR